MTLETIAGLAIAILTLGAATALRHEVVDPNFAARLPADLPPDTLQSPGPEALHIAALEHRHGAAELFWLALVQELGMERTQNYDRLERWSNLITDLDRQYVAAYHAPAVQFTTIEKNYHRSDRVLTKGIGNVPQEWRFPFLLGYNAYFGHGNPESAARSWLAASKLPRAPPFLISLAARAKFQTGNERAAEQMLVEMIPNLPEQQRTDAEIRLKVIRSEYVFRDYDKACTRYLEEFGERPTAKQLYDKGYVQQAPLDLFDEPIEIDEDCRARSRLVHVREDEAKERIGSQQKQKQPRTTPLR